MSDTLKLAAEWEPRVLSIVRIIAGLMFMEHGLGKLAGFPHVPNQPDTFHLLWFAGIIESVGGLLVAVGLFTRAAAFIMSGEMAVAYFMAHAPRAFYPMLNGGDAEALIASARHHLVYHADEAHDYKFSEAVFDNYSHLSDSAWRCRFLSAGMAYFKAPARRPGPVVEEIRELLQV